MPQPRKRHAPRRFDVHRTLPNPNQAAQPLSTDFTDLGEKKKRRFTKKKILLLSLLVLLIPVVIIAAWDYRNYARASDQMFGSSNLINVLPPNHLDSDDGRTNILIAGFSTDDPGHSGAELTDSIMVLSLDKDTKTGYMLAVPRDLYVEIPGYGPAKINEAYEAGKQMKFKGIGYPDGGMGLLEKVVSDSFDIDIHYYALINYGAVKDTVKALVGITVNIKSDDPRGIYDPGFLAKEGLAVKLKNGRQQIDAQTALNLTRARGMGYGSYGLAQADFDRTKNQQAVLRGIKEKITWQRLLDPRKNAPLLDAIANNVKTDLEIGNILPLYRLFNSVPGNKLKSVTLRDVEGQNLLSSYGTPTGQSALIPAAGIDDFSQIQEAIKQLE